MPVAFSDPNGDGYDEDFAELKVTNDNDFLFLRFSFYNSEQLLQDFNGIRFYIDTDNNSETGIAVHGIGAELERCFGCRQGIYHSKEGTVTIRQNDLKLRSAPTITSQSFEIAIGLGSSSMTLSGTRTADTIQVVLETSDKADLIPDQPGGVVYVIDTTKVEPPAPIPLSRSQEDHVRVLTYNTLGSGLLDTNRQPNFQRIVRALDPDIMAFQEQSGSDQVKALISNWLQESNLHSVVLGNNNMVVSKYPILNQAILTTSSRTMVVLLDIEEILGTNLLIINSHLACCRNDASRQQDADEIITIVRNWRSGNGPFPLPDNTPIIHLGDFNLVGSSHQLRTLAEGNIADEFTFGSDFFPDWDGTPLTDLFSRHTSIRMGYTWRSDNSSFSPGKLDYILYTDSVIEIGNHYVLNTLAISDIELNTYGLQYDDTNIASDHLPRIMDIASTIPVSVATKSSIPKQFKLYPAFPNPFNPTTTIKYSLSAPSNVILKVYDLLGREVAVLLDEFKAPGDYQVEFDASGLSSGVYVYKLSAGGKSQTRKLVLLK